MHNMCNLFPAIEFEIYSLLQAAAHTGTNHHKESGPAPVEDTTTTLGTAVKAPAKPSSEELPPNPVTVHEVRNPLDESQAPTKAVWKGWDRFKVPKFHDSILNKEGKSNAHQSAPAPNTNMSAPSDAGKEDGAAGSVPVTSHSKAPSAGQKTMAPQHPNNSMVDTPSVATNPATGLAIDMVISTASNPEIENVADAKARPEASTVHEPPAPITAEPSAHNQGTAPAPSANCTPNTKDNGVDTGNENTTIAKPEAKASIPKPSAVDQTPCVSPTDQLEQIQENNTETRGRPKKAPPAKPKAKSKSKAKSAAKKPKAKAKAAAKTGKTTKAKAKAKSSAKRARDEKADEEEKEEGSDQEDEAAMGEESSDDHDPEAAASSETRAKTNNKGKGVKKETKSNKKAEDAKDTKKPNKSIPKAKAKPATEPASKGKSTEQKALLSRKSCAYVKAKRAAQAEGLSPTKVKAAAKKAGF